MKIILLLILFVMNTYASQKIEIQGHRGARTVRPENTLNAFQYAMENDIDVLEMDLSYTKDRHLVLSHDEKINPEFCLDKNGSKIAKDFFIHEMTLKEVQAFDCGSLVNPKFPKQIASPKEKKPSFEEVLIAVQSYEKNHSKKFKLNVEIKVHNAYITKNASEIIDKLISLTKKYGIYERTIIQSFDINIVDQIRKKDSKIHTAFLINEELSKVLKALNLKKPSELIGKYKFNIISPRFDLIDRQFVKNFHSHGIQVIPWTVNAPADWKRMLNLKVDAIITDDPVGLKDFIK